MLTLTISDDEVIALKEALTQCSLTEKQSLSRIKQLLI